MAQIKRDQLRHGAQTERSAAIYFTYIFCIISKEKLIIDKFEANNRYLYILFNFSGNISKNCF
jgi:hypothetical protein